MPSATALLLLMPPGTELGGAYLSSTLLQPQCLSTFSTPTLGSLPVLLLPDGQSVSRHGVEGGGGGQAAVHVCTGELALVPPVLGSSQRLLNTDHYLVWGEWGEGGGRPSRT